MNYRALVIFIFAVMAGLATARAADSDASMAKLDALDAAMHSEPGLLEQPISHQDPSIGSFHQRYFIGTQFVANLSSAPVLLYPCAHHGCSSLGELPPGALWLARQLGAALVGLEERYRGSSQPFGDLSPSSLAYLTLENVLQDTRAAQTAISEKHGLRGPWIIYGGSYGGMQAAFYNARFPGTVAASVVSSGPILPLQDFREYSESVTRTLGPACSSQVALGMRKIETLLNDPTAVPKIAAYLQQPNDGVEIGYVTSDIISDLVQQMKTPALVNKEHRFCAEIANKNAGGAAKVILNLERETSAGFSEDIFLSDFELTNQRARDGTLQWDYLTCTQLGYFQNFSSPIRINGPVGADNLSLCRKRFGLAGPFVISPTLVELSRKIMNGQVPNLIFINFNNDPWAAASLTPEKVAQLGLANKIRAHLFDGGHCQDLSNDLPKDENQAILKDVREILSLAR